MIPPYLRRWLRLGGILLTVVFLLFAAIQVANIYQWGSALHPAVGLTLAIVLGGAIVVLIALPWVLLLQLPRALSLPTHAEDLPRYLTQLRKRLSNNPHIKDAGFTMAQLNTEEGLEQALSILDLKAREITEKTARRIFLITAISQNGKLDALAVLFSQMRLVWQVAQVYQQRPQPLELFTLYTNVGGATLLAVGVEDIDISEQIEPLVNSFVQNSATRSLPWAGSAAQVVVDSILEGTINAFFTLRVGVIAMRYSATQTPVSRLAIRRASYKDAVLKALKKSGKEKVKASTDAVVESVNKVKTGILQWAMQITNTQKAGDLMEKQERLPQYQGQCEHIATLFHHPLLQR